MYQLKLSSQRAFIFGLITCFLFPLFANSYQVQNVRFEDRGETIAVMYDLFGGPGQKFKIKIILQDVNGKSYRISIPALSGDVGKGIISGSDKTILWHIAQDYPEGLEGEGFIFQVQAELQKNKKLWPYIAVGAVAVTGFLLLNEKKGQKGNMEIDISDQF